MSDDDTTTTDVVLAGDQTPAIPRRLLIFAIDATASRQDTWARACQLQAEMFREASVIGHLDMQLVYYRGECVDRECRASGSPAIGMRPGLADRSTPLRTPPTEPDLP
jgi:hypothetical protein